MLSGQEKDSDRVEWRWQVERGRELGRECAGVCGGVRGSSCDTWESSGGWALSSEDPSDGVRIEEATTWKWLTAPMHGTVVPPVGAQ